MLSVTHTSEQLVHFLEQPMWQAFEDDLGQLYEKLIKQTAMQRTFWQGLIEVHTQQAIRETARAATDYAKTPAQEPLTATNGILLAEQDLIMQEKIHRAGQRFIEHIDENAEIKNRYATKSAPYMSTTDRHMLYCSNEDRKRSRCNTLTLPMMENADVRIDTLLTPGEGHYETLSDDEYDAASILVDNIVPTTSDLTQQGHSAETEHSYQVKRLAEQAALSLAAHSFNVLVARRTRRHQP
jgi:hypothetical protein